MIFTIVYNDLTRNHYENNWTITGFFFLLATFLLYFVVHFESDKNYNNTSHTFYEKSNHPSGRKAWRNFE
jgi:hypothetical protein